jgi:colanic acid/amylovoran biosynthesis protein
MTEKILLINIHSSKNVGDAALLQITLQQLEKNFPSSEFTLCTDDPDSHSGQRRVINSIFSWVHPFGRDASARWNYVHLALLLPATLIPLLSQKLFLRKIWLFSPQSIREIVNAYLDADLVVSKPGGFLYSSGRGISLLIAIYSILYAHLAGKPVYILPQSIGPFNHRWEKMLIRWLMERVRILMVREPISLKLIKEIGVKNPNCLLIPDLAFAMDAVGREVGGTWLRQNGFNPNIGLPLLGMTVINWGEQYKKFDFQAEYEAACCTAIRYFVEKINGRVVLFPQVWGPLRSQDDRIPAHRILKNLADISGGVKVVDEPLTAERLKSIYGWMDLFIGTRMHSNIFALSQGVPTIAIGYLHKTEGIAQMVGIEKWVIDIRQINSNLLQEKLIDLWRERPIWRGKIQAIVPKLIQEANEAGKMVAKDYFEYWKISHGS